jgi:NAD+-dependent secondary alcohol dehydrogenase Adh1
MKAVRLHDYGERPSVDEVDTPDLQSHSDVIVRVGGAGVCRTDLHLRDGWLKDILPVELPFTIGHETAGWVEAVGKDVTDVREGDVVIMHPLRTCGLCWACRTGEDAHCGDSLFPGINTDGGYAEYLRTSRRSLVPLAEGTDPADVAPYADAGITAYRAVRKAAEILQPGQTVAVLGAGGGLGHIGVQLLRELTGATIVAIDPAESGRKLALETGAHHAIDSEGAVEAVTELSGGADVVVDFVGEGDAVAQSVALLKSRGTYFVVGYGGELNVPTLEVVLKEISIVGNLVGSFADLSELMALAEAGRVKLHTQRYSLADAPQALEDLENGQVGGRAVLTP